ncbi:hypothetical protein [Geobacter sulfurreducens]|uniref:hypothetical protein n=1 Tax=Geobacter sulfurreducens TaxID=35554 RepID=UPI0025736306|nr:hypothetical protein [Geobacter sulfurreducens]
MRVVIHGKMYLCRPPVAVHDLTADVRGVDLPLLPCPAVDSDMGGSADGALTVQEYRDKFPVVVPERVIFPVPMPTPGLADSQGVEVPDAD